MNDIKVRESQPFRGMRVSKVASDGGAVPTDIVEATDLETVKPLETENNVESNKVENPIVEQKC
jgi:hypothetical protein